MRLALGASAVHQPAAGREQELRATTAGLPAPPSILFPVPTKAKVLGGEACSSFVFVVSMFGVKQTHSHCHWM